MFSRPWKRGLAYGAIGGVAGTVLMDIVMVTTFVLAGEPADTFFTMVGEKLGDGAILGLALHNAVGLSGGLVFALLVLGFVPNAIDSRKKGMTFGLAAGVLTIPLGCVPMAIWLGQPILQVVAFSLLPHIVWGLTLGWTMAMGLLGQNARIGKPSITTRSSSGQVD